MSCGFFCVGKACYFFFAGVEDFLAAGFSVLTAVVVVFLAVTFSPDSVAVPSLDSCAAVPSLAGAVGFLIAGVVDFAVGLAVAACAVVDVATNATEIKTAVSIFFILVMPLVSPRIGMA